MKEKYFLEKTIVILLKGIFKKFEDGKIPVLAAVFFHLV